MYDLKKKILLRKKKMKDNVKNGEYGENFIVWVHKKRKA